MSLLRVKMLIKVGLLFAMVLLPAPALALDIDISDATTPDEAAVSQTVAVFISSPHSNPITVNYSITNDSATEGLDYTDNTTGTLTFGVGDTVQSISIPIIDDVLDEDTERFFVNLTSSSYGTIVTSQASVYITDDDSPPVIVIGDNTTNDEGAGDSNLTVSLSAPSSKLITVNYATLDATASEGEDYTSSSGTIRFNPGDNSTVIPISVIGDGIDEENEQLYVNLSNPTNASIVDSQGMLTITDDDDPPDMSVADVTSIDENSVNIDVTLSNASGKPISANIATSAGTALSGVDFNSYSSSVNFSAGETIKTVTIPLINDGLDEDDETFSVDLSTPSNATITSATAIVTITDDDDAPNISIVDQTLAENASNLTATVTLDVASSKIITVGYATADGTATASNDYTSTSGSLTFTPGDLSQTFDIPIRADNLDEDNETFTVSLSSAVNAVISPDNGTATMTIADDDAESTISLAPVTASESDGTVNIVASLNQASERLITVDYQFTGQTATAGEDFAPDNGTISFAPGVLTQNIALRILPDLVDEIDETIQIDISNPTNARVTGGSAIVLITDDDSAPTISIDDTVIANETAVSRPVTVRLSAASGNQVTVSYVTSDGTASVNNDYNASTGTATFAPGEVTTTIDVTIISDDLAEGDENFFIDLSSATNATISDNQAEITITDDDAIPTVQIGDASTSDETAAALITTVTLSAPSSSAITLNWTTTDETAIAGDDYVTAGGMLIFNPGEVTKTVSVNILDDNIPEGSETFAISLSGINSSATISDDTAIMTIIDDDGSPTISASAVSAAESEQTVAISVALSFTSPLSITVDYATQDVTAIAGEDYTATSGMLTFAPGEQTKTLTIPLRADTAYEEGETFQLVLSNPVNAAIAAGTAIITITDDDEMLTQAQTQEITNAILFGKNSALRSETAFFGRILSRNTTLLSSNSQSPDGPVMSFRNVRVDWSDKEEFATGAFSFDNVRENGTRNTSWETSISHTKNDKGTKNTFVSSAFNFSKRSSGGSIYGLILGGGYSDTTMTGTSIGSNIGRSFSAGIYAAYPVSTSLMLDLMATRTYEFNTLDTRIGTAHVTGDYDRNSTSLSVGLQGNIQFAASAFRPKLKYTAGKSVFDSAIFDVRQGGLSSTQQIDFGTDEYFRFSLTPEFSTILGNRSNLLRPTGFNQFSFRPKIFCEKYNYETDKKCGQGLGLSFGNHHPSYNFDQDFTLDYDAIGGS